MVSYFSNNSFYLLQTIQEYLRRELKIPEYSQFFEESEEFKQEDFDKETAALFEANPNLLPKL